MLGTTEVVTQAIKSFVIYFHIAYHQLNFVVNLDGRRFCALRPVVLYMYASTHMHTIEVDLHISIEVHHIA